MLCDTNLSSWVISFNIGILWIIITCSIKFIHTFYIIDKFIIFQLILAFILIVIYITVIALHSESYKENILYFIITGTFGYISVLCIFLSFYIFSDLNFEFTLISIWLSVIASIIIEAWAIYSFIINYEYQYLLYSNIIIAKIWYIIFICTEWKSNK